MRISDWSSDVCSSDLDGAFQFPVGSISVRCKALPEDIEALDRVDLSRHRRRHHHHHHHRRRSARRKYHEQGYMPGRHPMGRSEEHTSELQSLMRISYAVFCLKKKK